MLHKIRNKIKKKKLRKLITRPSNMSPISLRLYDAISSNCPLLLPRHINAIVSSGLPTFEWSTVMNDSHGVIVFHILQLLIKVSCV